MIKRMDIEKLLCKPVAMMTGEEIANVIDECIRLKDEEKPRKPQSKKLVYGLRGIADLFHCSIPTAMRMKQSGILDPAISQVKRTIVVDADMALGLAKNSKEGKYHG
jgi:hypothetical protein